jgi:hypothetical protein
VNRATEADPQRRTRAELTGAAPALIGLTDHRREQKHGRQPEEGKQPRDPQRRNGKCDADDEPFDLKLLAAAQYDASRHDEERDEPERQEGPSRRVHRLPFDDLGTGKADRFAQEAPQPESERRS